MILPKPRYKVELIAEMEDTYKCGNPKCRKKHRTKAYYDKKRKKTNPIIPSCAGCGAILPPITATTDGSGGKHARECIYANWGARNGDYVFGCDCGASSAMFCRGHWLHRPKIICRSPNDPHQ